MQIALKKDFQGSLYPFYVMYLVIFEDENFTDRSHHELNGPDHVYGI